MMLKIEVIMKIDLSKINLNLLVALEALLLEQHVTRAAEKLNMSQSAMSNILKQLREQFNDELLLRGQSGKMLLTPKAKQLTKQIIATMEQTRGIFSEAEIFDPKTAKQTFTIGMSDYSELILLPPLLQYIEKHAPGITIVVNHLNYLPNSNLFENDSFDFSIGIYKTIPEDLIARTVFVDKSVYIGWKKNPLLQKPITFEEFVKADHLIILYFADRSQLYSEQYLKQQGLERRVVATVPHTLPALHCLPNTNLISVVSERMAKKMVKNLPLTYQPVIFKDCTRCEVKMVWHPKNRNNPAHLWMRDIIVKIAEKV